jgi:aromatic-L-amino-acid decarboxylase
MLDPTPDEIRRWGNRAVEAMADYFASIRSRRVYPNTTAAAIRQTLGNKLPDEPTDFDSLLTTFHDIVELSRHNGHPRMFGYVQGPGTALAAFADLLASTLNANLTAWRSAPAAVELERLTIDWIKQLLGCNTGAVGLFVSGGSMANFAALAAAQRAKAPIDLIRQGAGSLKKPMRIYISQETHYSVEKAAALLGLGRENVSKIAVDEQYKIRIDALVAAIRKDTEAGYLPFCVVANAGTVMTGAVDPIGAVNEVAQEFNLWMHVDAAYGGFAALSHAARGLFDGIQRADSIALDPHKWLYLPADCGCILYRDPEAARAAFAQDAEYTRVIGQQADEAFAFWDYGPELSRRFRALKVWMMLKGVGVRSLAEAIDHDLANARHLQNLVRSSDDFEMLAPVELSIFCFRYVPARFRQALAVQDNEGRKKIEQELNALNERLLIALQRDGHSYLSNALLSGRFALRGCVMNYRTTERDMEILLDDLRRVGRGLETKEAGR